MRQKPFPDWRGTPLGTPTYAQRLQNWQTSFNVDAFGNPVGSGGAVGSGGGGTVAPGNLAGAGPFNYSGPYGGIPQVPNPVTTAGEAVKGNLGNLGDIKNLATGVNAFTTEQAQAPLVANLPGYMGLIGQSSGNILSNLQGKLPQDVINLLQTQAAERGVAIGSPGSPNQEAALLRALGLTSLDLMGRGESQLTQAIGRTPVGPQLNLGSFLVSPESQQSAQAAANLYSAAPIPAQKAAADLAALKSGLGAGRAATGNASPTYNISLGRPQPTAPGSPASSYYSPTPFASAGPNYMAGRPDFSDSGVSPEVAAMAASLNGTAATSSRYVPGFDSLYGDTEDIWPGFESLDDDPFF